MNETVEIATLSAKAHVQVQTLMIAKSVLTLKMENIALLNAHRRSTQKMDIVSIAMTRVRDVKGQETQSLMMDALNVIMR
jgi:hypothetical protein